MIHHVTTLRRAGVAGVVFLTACAFGLLPADHTLANYPAQPAAQAPGPLPDLVVGVSRLKSSLIIRNRFFNEGSCSVVEGCITTTGSRRLLEFDTQIINQGDADAVLGVPSQHPDLYEFSTCHNHYHMKDSLDYAIAYGGSDTAALYDPLSGAFFLRNSNAPGDADSVFTFGPGGDFLPVVGDWDGDGDVNIGIYEPASGNFFLKFDNTPGDANLVFSFGPGGGGFLPIAGDWDGSGNDTVGIYDPVSGNFFLKFVNSDGPADLTFTFGIGGTFTPVAGDWDGDSFDSIGIYDPVTATVFLKNANADGDADLAFTYGPSAAGYRAVTGDWDANGVDTIGVCDPLTGSYFLKNANEAGEGDIVFAYGAGGAVPLVGDWDYDQTGPRVPDINGLKQAFCWLDSARVSGTLPGKYNCSNQGITAGWSDVYSRGLDCQWIDITGLAAGTYQLRVSVNDTRTIIEESNYENNFSVIKFRVTPVAARVIEPKVGVTAPAGGERFRIGKPVTVRWNVQDGQNITHQEVWYVPAYKKNKNSAGRHDDPDNRAHAVLIAENLSPSTRSFVWTPNTDIVLDHDAQILVRTQDSTNMVGTDTKSKGRFRIVSGNGARGAVAGGDACNCEGGQ